MATSLAMPMNIFYRDNVFYHELLFLLLFLYGFPALLQNIAMLFDIRSTWGLCSQLLINIFQFIALAYSRFYRFFPVVWTLTCTFYADRAYVILVTTGVAIVSMALLNLGLAVGSVNSIYINIKELRGRMKLKSDLKKKE